MTETLEDNGLMDATREWGRPLDSNPGHAPRASESDRACPAMTCKLRMDTALQNVSSPRPGVAMSVSNWDGCSPALTGRDHGAFGMAPTCNNAAMTTLI